MKKLLLLAILPYLTACGQTKPIDEKPLNLANFDFDTKITTLLPERTRSKNYKGYYKIKSSLIEVDTIKTDWFTRNEKPVAIGYMRKSYSTEDVLAAFGDFDFNAVNLVTALDGKMMAVNALAGEISLKETQSFVKLLDKKYGKAKKTAGEFVKPFDIFTWELKDRIIKYCIVGNDESNTIKIVTDKENQTIS